MVSISTLTVNGISLCIGIPNFIQMGNRRRSYDVILIFKMAASTELFLFPVSDRISGDVSVLRRFEVYHPTKFRRNNSIGGCDITTSVSEKQKSTTLELRFRIRCQRRHRFRHFITHRSIKFYRNQITLHRVMMSYQFSIWRPMRRNLTSGFGLGDVALFKRSTSISKTNFVGISYPQLRYNYFWCGKNKRPPYWNSSSGFDFDHIAVIGMLFCTRMPNFIQSGQSSVELWCHIDFQDGGRCGAILLYFRFRTGWRCSLQKTNVYQRNKFHWHNSIHSRDITISGLEKNKCLPHWNASQNPISTILL